MSDAKSDSSCPAGVSAKVADMVERTVEQTVQDKMADMETPPSRKEVQGWVRAEMDKFKGWVRRELHLAANGVNEDERRETHNP